MPHENGLGIAEGIETALSASVLYNMPVWAALTADLLENWSPPANVDHVVIFGDNDASSTGQAAAFGLAKRLKAKGLSTTVDYFKESATTRTLAASITLISLVIISAAVMDQIQTPHPSASRRDCRCFA